MQYKLILISICLFICPPGTNFAIDSNTALRQLPSDSLPINPKSIAVAYPTGATTFEILSQREFSKF